MREFLDDMLANQPLDPGEAARRNMRTNLRARFYASASAGEHEDGFTVLLDGKPLRTPARQPLAVPARGLAEAIAAEWETQREVIDPATMPLTRLVNTIIDGVSAAREEVAGDVKKYLGSDLLCYRAEQPDGLIARQGERWDPVLAWARDALGAHFVSVAGVTFAEQPASAVTATASAIPADPWRLGAVHAMTTLTGSALLALALAAGVIDADAAWAAAHVDEDWNMEFWGRDDLALQRRAVRLSEFRAAATVLDTIR